MIYGHFFFYIDFKKLFFIYNKNEKIDSQSWNFNPFKFNNNKESKYFSFIKRYECILMIT